MEYASKAVERGSFAVGVIGRDSVALAAVRSSGLRSTPEALLAGEWRERVHRVDDHVYCVSCGLVPDATTLLRALREFAQEHRRHWGEAAPVEVIAKQLSRHTQKMTQRAGGRPFGAAFLLAGFDEGDECPKLFKTDPAGTYDAYEPGTFACAGSAPDSVVERLEERVDVDADVVELAHAAALDAAVASPPPGRDDDAKGRATDVELAVLRQAGSAIVADSGLRERFDARGSNAA